MIHQDNILNWNNVISLVLRQNEIFLFSLFVEYVPKTHFSMYFNDTQFPIHSFRSSVNIFQLQKIHHQSKFPLFQSFWLWYSKMISKKNVSLNHFLSRNSLDFKNKKKSDWKNIIQLNNSSPSNEKLKIVINFLHSFDTDTKFIEQIRSLEKIISPN